MMTGVLVAIGGAVRLDGIILQEFYRRSGGADGQILILPTASQLDDSGFEYAKALSTLGLHRPAQVLQIRSRGAANRPDFCAAMEKATGLFLTGGDQVRLTEILKGTAFYHALQRMMHRGGTVAGTSAGAAALSGVMIASGDSGTLPYHNIASLSSGLGLIDSCIFDQHFSQRNRIGRLMYAVACHPKLIGIGIDEDTAAIIDNDTLTVIGSGAVTVVDTAPVTGSSRSKAEGSKLFPLSGVQLHILTQDGKYDLRKRSLHSATA